MPNIPSEAQVYSVQPRLVKPDASTGWAWVDSLFNWGTSENIPPYGSPARDMYMSEVWHTEPMLAGVFSSFAEKLQALPWWCIGPKLRAIKGALMCHHTERGMGFSYYIGKEGIDFLTCGKGAMTEKGRATKGDKSGPVNGFQHIDPTRMVWMASEESSYQYTWHYFPDAPGEDQAGVIPIPTENILQIIPAPSGRERYQRTGRCAADRLHFAISLMVGYLKYHRQQIGDLPPELVVILNNISQKQFGEQYQKFKTAREQKELSVWPGIFWLGSPDPANPVVLDLHSLVSLPDRFDFTAWAEWWVKTIALNVGQDVGEYWLIQQSGATKALQGIQHMKSRGKGPGRFIQEHELRMTTEVMPQGVVFKYDFQDDEQDRQKAEIVATNVDSLIKLAELGANRPKKDGEAEMLKALVRNAEDERTPQKPQPGGPPEEAPPMQEMDWAFSMAQIRKLAVEWRVIPPEVAGEQVTTILGAVLKTWAGSPDGEPIVRVGPDLLVHKVEPIFNGRTADKMQRLGQLLEGLPVSPFELKGGPGSGYRRERGHRGRPGKRGGSLPSLSKLREQIVGWLDKKGVDAEKRRKIVKGVAVAGGALVALGGALYLNRREDVDLDEWLAGTALGGRRHDIAPEGLVAKSYDEAMAMNPEELLAQMTGEVYDEQVSLTGAFGARVVVSPDGVKMIDKPFSDLDESGLGSEERSDKVDGWGVSGREAAVPRIAEKLGWGRFVPKTELAADGSSRQLFMDQARTVIPDIDRDLLIRGSRQGFIMDRLINSTDRHYNNAMVDPAKHGGRGELGLIDNGLSLGSDDTPKMTLDDIFAASHPTIRRTALNKSELGHVQALRDSKPAFDAELVTLVGRGAADNFWDRVDSTLETGVVPAPPEEVYEFARTHQDQILGWHERLRN